MGGGEGKLVYMVKTAGDLRGVVRRDGKLECLCCNEGTSHVCEGSSL